MELDVRDHYKALVDDYSAEYRPDWPKYPANQMRLRILVDRVRELGAKSLLDCGCGEGSPMRAIHDLGVDVWGFDFVPEMVQKGRDVILGECGIGDHIWVGDITRAESFTAPSGTSPRLYDVTMAMGVFPHVENEVSALQNMADATAPDGRVLVEFRNGLFSLFTLNRYSYEFHRDALLEFESLKAKHPEMVSALDDVATEMKTAFRMDLPKPRLGDRTKPGYDAILSKFHNPLTVHRLFEQAGLREVRRYFYHYHAIPPMFESRFPEMFRALSLEMEADPLDWRGHFMASAFVIEAVKER